MLPMPVWVSKINFISHRQQRLLAAKYAILKFKGIDIGGLEADGRYVGSVMRTAGSLLRLRRMYRIGLHDD